LGAAGLAAVPSGLFAAGAFASGAAFLAGAAFGASLVAVAFEAVLVLVAAPPADPPSPDAFRAASASDSSTLD
jgi:hypothetical protein